MRRSSLILSAAFFAGLTAVGTPAATNGDVVQPVKHKIGWVQITPVDPKLSPKAGLVFAPGGPLKTARPSPNPVPTTAPQSVEPASTTGQLVKALTNTIKATLGIREKSSSSSSSGTSADSSATNGNSGKVSIGYDDNASKNGGNPAPRGSSDTGGGVSGPGGGPKKAIAFDRWWPACIFFDPSVPNANEIVKGVVDMAAQCGVNLVVFPSYIQGGIGNDPASVNAAAQRSCNAVDGFARFGVNRASVATVVGNRSLVAAMCGGANGSDQTGCAQLGYDPGIGQQLRMANVGEFGGVAGVNKVASAIIGPGGYNAETVAKYLQGIAQMALPNGNGAGNGVGNYYEGNAAGGSQPQRGWSQSGCEQMRAASFPNDGRWRWNPDQEKYIVPGNESRYLPLGQVQLFHPPNPAPDGSGGGGGSSGGGDGGPVVNGGGGNDLASNRGDSGGSASEPTGQSGQATALVGGGHKNSPSGQGNRGSGVRTVAGVYGPANGGGSDAGRELASTMAAEAASDSNGGGAASQVVRIGDGPVVGGNGDRKSLGYDDSNAKNTDPGTGASDLASGNTSGGTGAGTGSSANGLGPGAAGASGSGAAGTGGTAAGGKAGLSLLDQVRNGNKILDDDFFKKIKAKAAENEARRQRPSGLRNDVKGRVDGSATLNPTAIYQ